MIENHSGSIFDSTAGVLVCPVNCEGTMGAGLAREFRDRFPETASLYRGLCEKGSLSPGSVVGVWSGSEHFGQKVILFPTKNLWHKRSRIEWIESGLRSFVRTNDIYWRYERVAFPMLGCGLGGLDPEPVYKLFETHLGPIRTICEVYR